MARIKPPEPPPRPELIEQAARDLARYQQTMEPEQWARLVRCKAQAKAKDQRLRRELAERQSTARPADLPQPGPRRPPMVPVKRHLFDARRAAANDMKEPDDD